MLFDVQEAITVAARAAVRIGIPFAGEPQPHVVVDARGNSDFALHAFLYIPLTATHRARVANDRARTVTGRTRCLHAENACALHDLAAAPAILAVLRLGAGTGTASLTSGAFLVPFKLHCLCDAAGGLEQIERNVAADVAAAGCPAAGAPAARATEDVAKTVAEDAAERLENVVDVVEVRRPPPGPSIPACPKRS